jgi:hypothetical protein
MKWMKFQARGREVELKVNRTLNLRGKYRQTFRAGIHPSAPRQSQISSGLLNCSVERQLQLQPNDVGPSLSLATLALIRKISRIQPH